MTNFFDMGGFGNFIWASYGITFIALLWLLLSSWRRAKNAARRLHDLESPQKDQSTR